MKKVKFSEVHLSIRGANGEIFDYCINNEYKNQSEEEIVEIFKLEPLHFATALEGLINGEMKSFNTYNWGAPITLCGVMHDDIYEGAAIVNIHLGGDVRGNYSMPYICEEPECVLSQNVWLWIKLSNGEEFNFDCDNGEGFFDFDTFDPYWIDFDEYLTEEQYKELKEKSNEN